METYVIDKTTFSITAVLEGLKQGRYPLCPVCRAPVHVARTPDEAKALGIPPGMQCSKVPRHFQVEFNLKPGSRTGSG
jgi:hypothetical protein